MSQNKDVNKTPAPTNNKGRTLLFVGLGILVILLAVKIYLDHQEKVELEDYYNTELTSAQEKLDEITLELEEKIQQIDSLGGDIEELLAVQEQITAERDQLQRTRVANRQLIGRLRRKTDGYEELLKEKDKEIERLTALNESLLTENTGLKVEKNELNKSIVDLNEEKTDLQTKVDKAGRLEAENIMIYSVAKSGKERDGQLRKRQIAQLKVVFSIANNDLAPLATREIMIRIKDQNDQVIFDVAIGSGSFMLDGKETFYTAKQDIIFDNSNQQLSFVYDKGTPYESGSYTMEVFTEDYLMGAKTFVVR
jgi:hypothetical protein